MAFLKWLKGGEKKPFETKNPTEGFDDEEERRRVEAGRDTGRNNEEEQIRRADDTKIIYFAFDTVKENVLDVLKSLNKDLQTFVVESECIAYIAPLANKVFLVIDGTPSTSFIEEIDKLNQIDSVFVYSSATDATAAFHGKQHNFVVQQCENNAALVKKIKDTRDELDKHTAAFSMYNKKEKSTRDLTKEAGSFLFFQLFKSVLKNIPKTPEAKQTMVTTCLNYYRGNETEIKNIKDFDKTYKSAEAISWYTKETFVYKFINKALRTEDVDVLYQFRFYIMDLSEQLEKKFLELKETQRDILRLYRGLKLSPDEVTSFEKNIGNLISTNGYLSTSSDRSVAYGFATGPKREGTVRALFEYQIDLDAVKKIVIADIHEHSRYPEEAEVLVDIGASFQIDSCQYNADEDLWHVQVHATDQGAELAAEYMEYQKKKMTESNIVLMLGTLFLEMGEYAKAERYFDTILSSSNPNDEEIACIFFNVGRTHRLRGDFGRAITSYNRAYKLHMEARPKRSASAGKTLNGLGVVFSEQGRLLKAEEFFQHAMKLYRKSIPKKHVDVAGVLINLGTIDCDRQDYDRAAAKYLKAKKIYDRSLPPGHPNRALPRVNLGNVYLAAGQYGEALEEYESALQLQEASLPGDHPDVARTLHNLAVVHAHRGNMVKAREYLERAEETAGRTLSAKHPMMALLGKTKDFMVDETKDYSYSRH